MGSILNNITNINCVLWDQYNFSVILFCLNQIILSKFTQWIARSYLLEY